ncbi:MAG TPA: hypothetical protein VIT21_12460 [Chthoniobacterales bacterium]
MPEGLNILPDERLAELDSAARGWMRVAAGLISAESFLSFADPVMRGVLTSGFQSVGADEGTLWLSDHSRENLVAAFNSGPHGAQLAGRFKQPLTVGMLSLVFASEQPICEREVYKNQQQDSTLDRQLGVLTSSMIATPFYFAEQLRGVISCVRLKRAGSSGPDPPAFFAASIGGIELTARVLSQLIDHRLLMIAFGRENS